MSPAVESAFCLQALAQDLPCRSPLPGAICLRVGSSIRARIPSTPRQKLRNAGATLLHNVPTSSAAVRKLSSL